MWGDRSLSGSGFFSWGRVFVKIDAGKCKSFNRGTELVFESSQIRCRANDKAVLAEDGLKYESL